MFYSVMQTNTYYNADMIFSPRTDLRYNEFFVFSTKSIQLRTLKKGNPAQNAEEKITVQLSMRGSPLEMVLESLSDHGHLPNTLCGVVTKPP